MSVAEPTQAALVSMTFFLSGSKFGWQISSPLRRMQMVMTLRGVPRFLERPLMAKVSALGKAGL